METPCTAIIIGDALHRQYSCTNEPPAYSTTATTFDILLALRFGLMRHTTSLETTAGGSAAGLYLLNVLNYYIAEGKWSLNPFILEYWLWHLCPDLVLAVSAAVSEHIPTPCIDSAYYCTDVCAAMYTSQGLAMQLFADQPSLLLVSMIIW